MDRALERALCDLVLGPSLDLQDPNAVSRWLDRHGVSTEDAAALRAAVPERLLIYRELVQNTLRDAVQIAFPRSVARLGELFEEYFARFLSERGPRTHYLRDVSDEFMAWAEAELRKDARVPAYVIDLMRHEGLRIEIAALPAGALGVELGPLELDRTLEFIAASRVVRYDFAVHELSNDPTDTTEPKHEPTVLFVYRSPEHEVRYMRLSPLAAAILGKLHTEQRTLRDALTLAAAELGFTLSEQVLEGAAQLLADLAERGALQGSAVS